MKPGRGASSRVYEWVLFIVLTVAGSLGLVFAFVPSIGVSLEAVAVTLLSLLSISLGLEKIVLTSRMVDNSTYVKDSLQTQSTTLKRMENRLSARLELPAEEILSQHELYLDALLSEVFKTLLEERLARLREAVVHGGLVLDREEDFRSFYIRALKYYEGEDIEFVATSLPTSDYFWGDLMLRVVSDFVRSGSRMKRIFLLDEGDESKEEVKEILRRQANSRIEVFTAQKETVSPYLRSNFIMVTYPEVIAWEVDTQGSGKPREIKITTDIRRIGWLHTQIRGIHKEPFKA